MSLFPRYSSSFRPAFDNDFRALFRMMDDFASNYEQQTTTSIRAFSPRFDVEEKEDAYHLHGELPGIDQKNIQIEFNDPHTLVIKGSSDSRVERYEGGEENGKVEDADAKKEYRQPNVEDENAAKTSDSTAVVSSAGSKEVAKADATKPKLWISERSVGEFYRSFSFPSRVDQDGVKANLSKGVLSIVVPKLAYRKGSKRINIESTD